MPDQRRSAVVSPPQAGQLPLELMAAVSGQPAGGVDQILADLNDAQHRAVTHETGPLLIVAGAGTGKTQVITRRIAWLIATKRAWPSEILALTFTDKAAAEMEERVDVLVPYGYTDAWISTFHAFGDRVLRDHALDLGLRPDFRVLSKAEQVIFVREHLFEFPLDTYRPLGDPTRYIEAMLALISRAKDEDASPAEYRVYADRDAHHPARTRVALGHYKPAIVSRPPPGLPRRARRIWPLFDPIWGRSPAASGEVGGASLDPLGHRPREGEARSTGVDRPLR